MEFFEKHCQKFDHEEENKLEYTQIHKEYEDLVEAKMTGEIGAEKMQKIELGLNEYIKRDRKGGQSQEVMEAIEVLSALGDFNEFKAIMLAKKAEMNGEGGGAALNIINKGVLPVLDVKEHMDKIEGLMKEASVEDGWTNLINDPGATAYLKTLEDGDTVMRITCELDLKPEHCFAMFTTTNDDMLTWYTDLKKLEVVEEFTPDDKLTKWTLNLSWALQYIMSIPEVITIRLVTRKNWPEENHFAYCTIPYDSEKNIPVEQYGPIKIESGCVMPHPEDPNKCILSTLDKADFKYMPDFAIKMLIRKEMIGKF